MSETFQKPVIIVDTREQTPLSFTRLAAVRQGLPTGDYSVLGHEDRFAVERKSLDDLIRSVTRDRERFIRELQRFGTYGFRRLLIVSSRFRAERHFYTAKVSPKAVIASVAALEIRYNVPAVWIPDTEQAAKQIEDWAYYWVREQAITAEKAGRKPAAA